MTPSPEDEKMEWEILPYGGDCYCLWAEPGSEEARISISSPSDASETVDITLDEIDDFIARLCQARMWLTAMKDKAK